jgi:hypothetical protein
VSLTLRPMAFSASARFASRSTGGRNVAGAPGHHRLLAAQHLLLQGLLGKPSGGKPSSPLNSETTDSGKATSRAGSLTSAGRQVVGDHEQRHVAHHLGGRRHLDDVAEQEFTSA